MMDMQGPAWAPFAAALDWPVDVRPRPELVVSLA